MYGVDLSEIHIRIARDGDEKLLKAPKEGKEELVVDGLSSKNVKFLVYGLNKESSEVQKEASLEEVKSFIKKEYDVEFNSEAIEIKENKITINGSILSTEAWRKVKENGNKEIPYRITVLNGDKSNKVAKIAMYEDGVAVIEDLNK